MVDESIGLEKWGCKPIQLREAVSGQLWCVHGRTNLPTFGNSCETPPEHISHWTQTELAKKLINRGASREYKPEMSGVFYTHKGTRTQGDLKPHRIKYYLNHEEEDETAFRHGVRTVFKHYHQAQEQHESGKHVVSIDEKKPVTRHWSGSILIKRCLQAKWSAPHWGIPAWGLARIDKWPVPSSSRNGMDMNQMNLGDSSDG